MNGGVIAMIVAGAFLVLGIVVMIVQKSGKNKKK